MRQFGTGRGALSTARLALSIASALWISACSKPAPLTLGPNARPTLELTQAPISSTQPFFYGYELRWAGFDIDGRIDHFRYVIDPPTPASAETVWTNTRENRKAFFFHADKIDTLTDQTAEGFHTIVLEAVDDRGEFSAPVSRSFTSFTIAPTVQITQPAPDHFVSPTFGPSFHLGWKGSDPDGRTTTRPVQYKFKIFLEGGADFDFLTLLVNPDSLRRRYAPHFSEWDSVGGDTTGFDFHNLTPDRRYVVAVVAFDEVGAYSPVMSFDVNMLFFKVRTAGLLGPTMTVFNESLFFTYSSGGFSLDPANYIRTEVAADRPVRFNWLAAASSGSFISGYRWMMDGNVGDDTPRQDEGTDLHHWSQYSPLVQSAELPAISPAAGSETHYLYIEAIDNNNLLSLAVVQFTVVRPIFDRQLLIVDDTRVTPDRLAGGGCVESPRGAWPTAAELDTFFFARGGKPWKCYPTGTLSAPGIFQGYDYDTLGTRFLANGTLTLKQLSHYRHVIWYTEFKASLNTNSPDYTESPMSELRWLSVQGRSNPLGIWVAQGGELWMFGGGVASSLQRNWEKSGPADVYSNTDGELVQGRFMYDVFGWRSEITAKSISSAFMPAHPIGRTADSPDYSSLPNRLLIKTEATDPMTIWAPTRNNPTDFYTPTQIGEAVTKPNDLFEDHDPDPNITFNVPVLDTLYETTTSALGANRPLMTLWHGGTSGQRQVFSGFQLWYWQRDQQIRVLDWVLQTVWHLPRRNVAR